MVSRLAARLRNYAEKDGRGYPDWALRYAPIARRLRAFGLERRVILEVGANENGLARFTGAVAIAVDIEVAHLRAARAAQPVTPVVASVAALPFRDGTFDIAVCVDTFEHLPAEARAKAVDELLRVVRDTGISVTTFPSGAAAARAEAIVRDEYRRYTGGALRWLEEHTANRLPDAAPIADLFRKGVSPFREVRQETNAPVWLWLLMWRILMCGWPGRGNAIFQVVLRWLTPLLCRLRIGKGYRTMIWVEPKA
ncbi:MAG: class I SAM-dependent methyltransferase [Candidatus Hydrogenedentes bacterium]|nr:class I SAM-dependent methyltransferase [Candidatus Hydrogenedentota bacterium]